MTGDGRRIGVIGASGFIGSHVVARGHAEGRKIDAVRGFRVVGGPVGETTAAARLWRAEHRSEFERLSADLDGYDAVVNAAGLGQPASTRAGELLAANAVHPAVVAMAAREAGVTRLVHVSSAVVQGRLDPLDESARHHPPSPYAASKAAAERALRSPSLPTPPEVVIYRPTAVQSERRRTTRRLARLVAALPCFPLVEGGRQPAPVALAENVAAGILFAAGMPSPPPVALQPWEGVTVGLLVELLGPRRVVSLPRAVAGPVGAAAARLAAPSARLTSALRRLEVVLNGQGVDARALPARGFVPPVGIEGWAELGRRLRRREA